jgi:hypothetical protein
MTIGPAERGASRALPPVFDRLVMILTVQNHVFAAFLIVQERAYFRSLAAVVGVWLCSFAVPLVCLVAARRHGGVLPIRAFVLSGVALIAIDLALLGLVPAAQLGTPAMWIWGTVGVTVLTLAPFRPTRDILFLAASQAACCVAATGWAAGRRGVDGFRVLGDLNAVLVPALAAAQFIGLYVVALRSREQAATDEMAARGRLMAAAAVESDTVTRLARVRSKTVPLLRAVIAGQISLDDPGAMAEARRMSDELRRELLESRSGAWLIGRPPRETSEAARTQVPDLLDPQHCLERLSDADRASLTAFIEALYDQREWDRLSVALVSSSDEGGDRDLTAALTVVALGSSAAAAARDRVVVAAARGLRASLASESPGVLTADAILHLHPERA